MTLTGQGGVETGSELSGPGGDVRPARERRGHFDKSALVSGRSIPCC